MLFVCNTISYLTQRDNILASWLRESKVWASYYREDFKVYFQSSTTTNWQRWSSKIFGERAVSFQIWHQNRDGHPWPGRGQLDGHTGGPLWEQPFASAADGVHEDDPGKKPISVTVCHQRNAHLKIWNSTTCWWPYWRKEETKTKISQPKQPDKSKQPAGTMSQADRADLTSPRPKQIWKPRVNVWSADLNTILQTISRYCMQQLQKTGSDHKASVCLSRRDKEVRCRPAKQRARQVGEEDDANVEMNQDESGNAVGSSPDEVPFSCLKRVPFTLYWPARRTPALPAPF